MLWKAAIVEINKDKAEHKIEYHTTKMFSKLDQATIKKNWIEEMSEGVPKLDKSMAEETEENVVVRTISLFLIFRTSLTLFKTALQNLADKNFLINCLKNIKFTFFLELFFIMYGIFFTKIQYIITF